MAWTCWAVMPNNDHVLLGNPYKIEIISNPYMVDSKIKLWFHADPDGITDVPTRINLYGSGEEIIRAHVDLQTLCYKNDKLYYKLTCTIKPSNKVRISFGRLKKLLRK